jgi:hypothetical protein
LSAHLILFSGDAAKIIVGGRFLIPALFLFFLWIAMLIDAVKHSKDDSGG